MDSQWYQEWLLWFWNNCPSWCLQSRRIFFFTKLGHNTVASQSPKNKSSTGHLCFLTIQSWLDDERLWKENFEEWTTEVTRRRRVNVYLRLLAGRWQGLSTPVRYKNQSKVLTQCRVSSHNFKVAVDRKTLKNLATMRLPLDMRFM